VGVEQRIRIERIKGEGRKKRGRNYGGKSVN